MFKRWFCDQEFWIHIVREENTPLLKEKYMGLCMFKVII